MGRVLEEAQFSQDRNAVPIPVMSPGSTASIAVATASARVALPGNAVAGSIVRVAVTQDTHIAFGDGSVNAATTDMLLTSGAIEYLVVPADATNIAAIRQSTDGILRITEMT